MQDLILVFEKQDKPMTDSLKVGEYFKKDHKNVLRDVEVLECSDEFRQLNFELSNYKSEQNKKLPKFNMTFDGFVFLAMGYNGKKAAQIKESYIKAFNSMKDFIGELQTAKEEFKELSEAIKLAHLEDGLHSYHFSNEYDLINRIVLGMSTKKYKKTNGIPDTAKSIRPFLTADQIKAITRLEKFDTGLMLTVEKYDERKTVLTNYYSKINGLKQLQAS
jgi:Rha family phage regulatory protein